MRIISGKARGAKLFSPPGKSRDIRPTSDRCKEALFSILADKVIGACVLDLFAGTGSLGLEALSRGAQAAVFVDNSSSSLVLIKKNAARVLKSCTDIKKAPHISIMKGEIPQALVYILTRVEDSCLPFDIIFLDPPYGKGFPEKTIEALNAKDVLAEGGIIVVEESSKVSLADDYQDFVLFDKRKYGDTHIWLYAKR